MRISELRLGTAATTTTVPSRCSSTCLRRSLSLVRMFGMMARMAAPFRKQPPRLPEVFARHKPALYFLTFCTMYRRSLLACDQVHAAFRRYATRGAEEHRVFVGRYVIMPDHVHLFVAGDADFDIGIWVKGLKRALAAVIPTRRLGTAATTPTTRIWQPGILRPLVTRLRKLWRQMDVCP